MSSASRVHSSLTCRLSLDEKKKSNKNGMKFVKRWRDNVKICAYRTFLFCPLCLASFLSLLIAQLILSERLDQEGKCLEQVFFFRILNTPREFFVESRRKLINMLRSVQNIHVETAYNGLSQVHWLSLLAARTCPICRELGRKCPKCGLRAPIGCCDFLTSESWFAQTHIIGAKFNI